MNHVLTRPDGRREISSTITAKGQVTIPAQVRRHLGVTDGDKITFVVQESGEVRIAPARFPTIASLKGAAGKLSSPLTWKEIKQIAREDQLSQRREEHA